MSIRMNHDNESKILRWLTVPLTNPRTVICSAAYSVKELGPMGFDSPFLQGCPSKMH